ncbi:MAG TPA: methyltransferase domain-containing protein [Vicinamibacterales bacterium]|nr:methyltransferase domain-containing protein [Vicinamibacterales bacterium]
MNLLACLLWLTLAQTPDMYFAPTSDAVADAMLKLARVQPDDVVYDLGSGDGRIVIMAAQKYGARGVGIEIQPRLVEIARQVAREGEVAGRVKFIEGDLFTADISEATVVTLYLSPGVNRRLEAKLKSELRPGTRIVSHQFRIGDWAPEATVRAEDGTDLFLWRIPDNNHEAVVTDHDATAAAASKAADADAASPARMRTPAGSVSARPTRGRRT